MKRVTVKIGTRVLSGADNKLDKKVIKHIADQVAELMARDIQVVIVTSGAIGAGLGILEEDKKNKSLAQLQAIASLGQNYLMDIYNHYFIKKDLYAGQILLTQDDFNDRKRYLNIKYTLEALFERGAVPIINENDSVSTEEIKCGDNDRLSFLVSDLIGSDVLIILTDVDGLFDDKGHLVRAVENIDDEILSYCKKKECDVSTGGMIAKLGAVKDAVTSGIRCYIAAGKKRNVITHIMNGKKTGTEFMPLANSVNARKRWIGYTKKSSGAIIVDDGASYALIENKKSLLPSGIVDVKGKFSQGDVVSIENQGSKVIAKGISNYSSDEAVKIKGQKSSKIESILGYKDYDEFIHRDNLVIV